MGIDFMTLLSNDGDDDDSAFDSGDESAYERRKRRFSQQMSCVGDFSKSQSRTGTFVKQDSVKMTETNVMQSGLSIASETREVEVYVSPFIILTGCTLYALMGHPF